MDEAGTREDKDLEEDWMKGLRRELSWQVSGTKGSAEAGCLEVQDPCLRSQGSLKFAGRVEMGFAFKLLCSSSAHPSKFSGNRWSLGSHCL